MVATEIFLFLFIWHSKVYDVSTATFFALSLGLLARRKFLAYYLLFPVGCLNRETAILMTLIYAFYFHNEHKSQWIYGAIYQVVIYAAIRVWLIIHFAGTPGAVAVVRPIENMQMFFHSPISNLLHWSFFLIVLLLCARHWRAKPILLRSSFLVLVPVLTVLYLIVGYAFEIRVFAELYPVAFSLIAGVRT